MSKIDKWVVAGIFIVIFSFAIVIEHYMNKRIDECSARGGVLTKTVRGYECVKGQVI